MLGDHIDPIRKIVTINREHVHLLWEEVKIAISKSISITDHNIPQLTARTCTVPLINLGWSECSWPRFLGIWIKLGYRPLIQFWLSSWFFLLTSDPRPSFPPAFSFGFVSWCQVSITGTLSLHPYTIPFASLHHRPPSDLSLHWELDIWIRAMVSGHLHLFFILALCRGNLIMSHFCLESFNCLLSMQLKWIFIIHS